MRTLALLAILAQGILEPNNAGTIRPALDGVQAGVPATRGAFRFPAPYGTQAYRITDPSDCAGGQDCVQTIGYSYWPNASASAGSDTMYIFVTLSVYAGGTGPNLFTLHKLTKTVTRIGPLFTATDPRRYASGEGWYFSATRPTTLYMTPTTTSSTFHRLDVLTRATSTVFDLASNPALFGTNRYLWQLHSSNDDTVHSFTVRDRSTYADLGCGVYLESAQSWRYYPAMGAFDECQIDRSGRWLLIKENVDGRNGEDNRIIDLQTGRETLLLDEHGGMGHSDIGFGWVVGRDNWFTLPTVRLWQFGTNPLGPGSVVYRDPTWNTSAMNHLSWSGATTGPLAEQMVCGSNAATVNGPRSNEIGCFKLDGALMIRVVAPVLTNMDTQSAGGDDYAQMPKGNLDPTGRYFIWSTNLGTDRTDVLMVEVTTPLPSAPVTVHVTRP